MAEPNDDSQTTTRSAWARPVVLVLVLLLIGFAGVRWRNELSLDRLALRQQEFREALNDHPVAVTAVAFVVYVGVTSVVIGSATAVSLLYGWLFGWFAGTLIVSFASTTGATLTFLASRYLFRGAVERRFSKRIRAMDRAFRRSGSLYLLSLRLIPGIPFFLLNAAMGLTPIRLRTYWWVSQLGMLPATLLFVYAGSTVPDLATLRSRGVSSILTTQFVVALLILGLLPLAIAWLRRSRWLRSIDAR